MFSFEFCSVTVWSPPPRPFDVYTGYDVHYSIPDGGEVIFNKQVDEFFQLVTEDVRLLGPQEQILVQVRMIVMIVCISANII